VVPQVLAGACSSTSFPQGHSLLQTSTCSGVGPSMGCRWISAQQWISTGCRGTACLTMVFHHRLQGILCSGTWSTSFPLLHWPWCLQSSHSSLLLQDAIVQFYSFLKYIATEVLPLPLMGLALASGGSFLELAGVGSVGRRGSFSQLLTEATPVVPLLLKPCHTNSVQHDTAWNNVLGLEKQILQQHGTPERTESDNRTPFLNNLTATWAKEHGIEWVYPIPCHAAASGKIEQYNGLLKTMLRALGVGPPNTGIHI